MDSDTTNNDVLAITAILAGTEDNRFITISPSPASPLSFAGLVDKICSAFTIRQDNVALTYIDDEGDRVTISSDDELACALSAVPVGQTLRLFVDTSSKNDIQPQELDRQVKEGLVDIDNSPKESTSSDDFAHRRHHGHHLRGTRHHHFHHDHRHRHRHFDQELVDKLKQKVAQEEGSIVVCDKKARRLLARFDGDVDKAAAAVRIWWTRTHARDAAVGREDERKASREERIAARIARKRMHHHRHHRKHAHEEEVGLATDASPSTEEVESLAEQMNTLGFVAGKGARRRCHGDPDQAKLHRHHRCGGQQHKVHRMERRKERLLARFDGDETKVEAFLASKMERRKERLLVRFNGDMEQVEAFLAAKKARHDERAAKCHEKKHNRVQASL